MCATSRRTFRHHFSHTWLDRGGPEGDLMELNGWTSPQMVRRYGASARSARARRTYDRVMEDAPLAGLTRLPIRETCPASARPNSYRAGTTAVRAIASGTVVPAGSSLSASLLRARVRLDSPQDLLPRLSIPSRSREVGQGRRKGGPDHGPRRRGRFVRCPVLGQTPRMRTQGVR
jgi:hypothetical protein